MKVVNRWVGAPGIVEWARSEGLDAHSIYADTFDIQPNPDGPGHIAIFQELKRTPDGGHSRSEFYYQQIHTLPPENPQRRRE